MATKHILAVNLTPGMLHKITKMKWLVHAEIHSEVFWKTLLETGFNPEEWSKNNYGNKIYLKTTLWQKRKKKKNL